MASLCSPCPAGYVPPVCSNIPGYGPLSREHKMSVAAELPSGTKLVSVRSLICFSFDTEPISVSIYLTLIMLLPPSFCMSHVHTNKYTPVFAKGEREREEKRPLGNTS